MVAVPEPLRLLFVCSRARRRSATAEALFATVPDVEAMAAGTASDADVPIDADAVAWADVILAMENVHRERLNRRFGPLLRSKRLIVLGIADRYDFMDDELVRLLRDRVARSLPDVVTRL